VQLLGMGESASQAEARIRASFDGIKAESVGVRELIKEIGDLFLTAADRARLLAENQRNVLAQNAELRLGNAIQMQDAAASRIPVIEREIAALERRAAVEAQIAAQNRRARTQTPQDQEGSVTTELFSARAELAGLRARMADMSQRIGEINEARARLANAGRDMAEGEYGPPLPKPERANNDALREQMALAAEGERIRLAARTSTEKYSEAQANLNRLLQAGAIDQETYNRALRDANPLLQEGERLRLSVRTEAEKFADVQTNLNSLIAAGAIDQETYNRALREADPATKSAADAAARSVQSANALESNFTGAFTRAFEAGKNGADSFFTSVKNGMRSLAASIASQLVFRMAVTPVVNSVGGAFGFSNLIGNASTPIGGSTLGNLFGGGTANAATASAATGTAGSTGGGFSLSSLGSLNSLRNVGSGLGQFFPGGGAINTGFGFLDAGLNASTGIGSGSAIANSAATYGEGIGAFSNAGVTQASGAAAGGVSFGQLLGPAAAIGGGIYGMYSGIKKGGIGGYTGAAGGAVSAATGIGMLGAAAGLLPALGVLGPIGLALGAALALAGAFMPGKKASGKGQEVSINTLNGDRNAYGLGGSRFSQGNADYAGSLAGNVAGLESALQDQLGFGIDTTIGAGVTSGRKKNDPGTLYLRVGEQRAQFGNDEAGAKAFGETAGRFLLEEFKRASTGQGDKGSIVRNSGSIEDLGKNLDWYESTYKALAGIQARTTQFAESLRTLIKPYDDAIAKSQQLELATDALTKKRGEELEKALEPMLRNGLAAETYSAGLKAVTDNYEAVIRVAGELGRSTDDLTAAMGRAADKFRADAQRGFDGAIRAANGQSYIDDALAVRDNWNANAGNYLAAGRDPNALYAAQITSVINQLDASQLDNVIAALRGLDDVAVLFAEARKNELAIIQQQNAAVQTLAERQNGAGSAYGVITNMQQYVASLSTSDASAGTAEDRLLAARRQFDAIYGAAQAGDARSISGLQSAAETFRQSSRDIYGGGQGYADAVSLIGNRLDGVAGMGADALTQSFVTENARQNTDRIVDALADLRRENAALRSDINMLLMRPAA